MTRAEIAIELKDWAIQLEQPGRGHNPDAKTCSRIALLRAAARELDSAGQTKTRRYTDGWEAE